MRATALVAPRPAPVEGLPLHEALDNSVVESRGQTRALYVQCESAGAATLYAVVGGGVVIVLFTSVGPVREQPGERGRRPEGLGCHRPRGRHAGQRGLALGLGRLQCSGPLAVRVRPPAAGPAGAGAASPTVREGCVRVCG